MAKNITNRNWKQAFWTAGILVFLVELNAGVDYVQAGFNSQIGGDLGWLPTIGMIALKITDSAFWNGGAVHLVTHFVSLLLVPVLMLGLWVAAARSGVE